MLLNALQWARQAGAVQLGHFRQGNLDIRTKATEADVVTIADRESERLIIDGIHAAYPGHAILSEESGEEAGSGSGWRWIIDPLDGTTNYSQGLPLFSVSIALEHDGQVVSGVVYAPYTDELFHAVRGEGAFLNAGQFLLQARIGLPSVWCRQVFLSTSIRQPTITLTMFRVLCRRCADCAAWDRPR